MKVVLSTNVLSQVLKHMSFPSPTLNVTVDLLVTSIDFVFLCDDSNKNIKKSHTHKHKTPHKKTTNKSCAFSLHFTIVFYHVLFIIISLLLNLQTFSNIRKCDKTIYIIYCSIPVYSFSLFFMGLNCIAFTHSLQSNYELLRCLTEHAS